MFCTVLLWLGGALGQSLHSDTGVCKDPCLERGKNMYSLAFAIKLFSMTPVLFSAANFSLIEHINMDTFAQIFNKFYPVINLFQG